MMYGPEAVLTLRSRRAARHGGEHLRCPSTEASACSPSHRPAVPHSSRWRGRASRRAVLRAVTWRAVLVTQSLGLLFALYPWLEQWHRSGQPSLLLNLTGQAIAALLVMLAALRGGRGRPPRLAACGAHSSS